MFLKTEQFEYNGVSVTLSELSALQRIEHLALLKRRAEQAESSGNLQVSVEDLVRTGAFLVAMSLWHNHPQKTGSPSMNEAVMQIKQEVLTTWPADAIARAEDVVLRLSGMAEDLQSLVGATVVRRRVYARFLDALNFVAGNPEADPEQELSDRWVVEQLSELTAMTASFVLATPTETDGALFPGRIMLANTCMWDYRGDECGYNGPAVADEFDNPTTDIRRDRCSKCMRGCELRGMVANFGGFLSINKLSQ